MHKNETFSISFKTSILLFSSSFIIRALVMMFLIGPNGYYKQADSMDYHNCALGMALGSGMHRIDSKEPIFWRTPGYPLYLAKFYNWYGIQNFSFDSNKAAQQASIWFQILVGSFIPLIFFLLAQAITANTPLAWIMAWIGVLHPGLILTSTYLLTEGLALIFFYLFLLYLYGLIFTTDKKFPLLHIVLAAINLSIYTWMRPMGEFVAILAAVLLFFSTNETWQTRLKKALLFVAIFFTTLFPWYLRNYQLTNEWFFCPTIGTYLNVFCAPKIVRRATGKDLVQCHKELQYQATKAVMHKKNELKGTGLHVSNNVCKQVAYPLVQQYPVYFIFDWIAEVIKTTLDLYTYQLIPMITNCYYYDPIEEYLPEKIAACLYAQKMPLIMRVTCWVEFITALLIWIGLFAGLWLFVIQPLAKKQFKIRPLKIWLTLVPMIGIIVGMTGGFGYARLRLPAEPLILILSLLFWIRILRKKQ